MASIDIAFPLLASAIVPRDHGYGLYAALSRSHAELHGVSWLCVHPLSGTAQGDQLHIEKGRDLRIRVPDTHIATVLSLTGRRLDVHGATLRLGVPRVYRLACVATLDARLVYIKLTSPPTRRHEELNRDTLDNDGMASRYGQEIRRQLDRLQIGGTFELRGRRSITVAGKRLVGFSVRVGELHVDESLRLQENGLGGKRSMGCGVFRPTRRRRP